MVSKVSLMYELTKDKNYTVLHIYNNQVRVINDRGFEWYYDRELFEVLK